MSAVARFSPRGFANEFATVKIDETPACRLLLRNWEAQASSDPHAYLSYRVRGRHDTMTADMLITPAELEMEQGDIPEELPPGAVIALKLAEAGEPF